MPSVALRATHTYYIAPRAVHSIKDPKPASGNNAIYIGQRHYLRNWILERVYVFNGDKHSVARSLNVWWGTSNLNKRLCTLSADDEHSRKRGSEREKFRGPKVHELIRTD